MTQREKLKQQEHAPYKGALLDLYKLCRAVDRCVRGMQKGHVGGYGFMGYPGATLFIQPEAPLVPWWSLCLSPVWKNWGFHFECLSH